MKKSVLILILVILLISLASATYICSDGTELQKTSKEIDEWKKRTVNGLGIALIKAEEVPTFKRVAAELILQAEIVSLSNDSISEEIEISGDEYNITLMDATDTEVIIDIDGSSEGISEGTTTSLKGLKVMITSADEEAGIISAEIIIGTQEVSLSNDATPSIIVTFDSKDYLLEIISASDTDATISVSKCENATATIEEEEEQEPEEDEEEPEENITTQDNETSEINQTQQEEQETEETKSIFKNYLFWLFIIVIVVIIVGYVFYRKSKI